MYGLLNLHMLPAPVHRTVMNAVKCTKDSKFLRPGQQLEFKPPRDRSTLSIRFKGKRLQIQRQRSSQMKLFHKKAQVFSVVTLCLGASNYRHFERS